MRERVLQGVARQWDNFVDEVLGLTSRKTINLARFVGKR